MSVHGAKSQKLVCHRCFRIILIRRNLRFSGVNFSCLESKKQKRRSLVLCLTNYFIRTTEEELRRGDIVHSVSMICQNRDTSTWIHASLTILILTYHGYTEEMTKRKRTSGPRTSYKRFFLMSVLPNGASPPHSSFTPSCSSCCCCWCCCYCCYCLAGSQGARGSCTGGTEGHPGGA